MISLSLAAGACSSNILYPIFLTIHASVWNGTDHKLNTFGIISASSSGLGLGLNFSNIMQLVKRIGKKKVVLYTVCPAEIKIGVGSNFIRDPEKAIQESCVFL